MQEPSPSAAVATSAKSGGPACLIWGGMRTCRARKSVVSQLQMPRAIETLCFRIRATVNAVTSAQDVVLTPELHPQLGDTAADGGRDGSGGAKCMYMLLCVQSGSSMLLQCLAARMCQQHALVFLPETLVA